MSVSDPMSEVSERLIQARKAAGFDTAIDAAHALGVKPPTYYSHENGSIGLRSEVATKYARKFKVSLDWLLTGRGEMSPSGVIVEDFDVAGLPLLGSIQAGHWLETTFADAGTEFEMVQVARDPRFPHAKQYALRVVGDSMDLDFPDGSIVTCVDFAESGLSLTEGMIIHVERQRAGAQLVEITLKYVEWRRGEFVLVPHSTNPKYVPFHMSSNSRDSEVMVRGIVTGSWRPTAIPSIR